MGVSCAVWNYFAKPVSIREFNRNLAQLAKVMAREDPRVEKSNAQAVHFPVNPPPTGTRTEWSSASPKRCAAIMQRTARRRPRSVFEDEPLPILPAVQAQFRVQLPHLPDAPADRVSVPFAQ